MCTRDEGWPAGLSEELRLGELFCGPGGLALGAHKAQVRSKGRCFGFRHAWANDLDESTCETYRRNIPGASRESVICGDVRSLDITHLPPIDCLAFGFPCNDYSVVGEQLGLQGTFGPLYSYGVATLNEHSPATFIAENVGGLASADAGQAFHKIVSELANAGAGYRVTAHLYKCEDYGVPQTRHRILMVGVRTDLNRSFKVPRPTHSGDWVSSRTAIESPPIPVDALNHEFTRQAAQVVERLKHIRPGENAFNATLPEHLRLNVRGATISQIYKRLDPDKPSYTITGSGGGGTHVYHWSENRALTNRERARLQTFPDTFRFFGKKESVRRQIGMAVPPRLANVVATALLKTLAGVPYASINPSMDDTVAQARLALERRHAYA